MTSRVASVGDHLATNHPEYRSGVYRVVGTDNQRLTLLLVGDSGGKRIHTGLVISVDRSTLDSFEPAEQPLPDRSVTETVLSGLSIGYWSLRANARQLRVRPIRTAAVAVLLAGGLLLDRLDLVPEIVASAAVVTGSVLVVLVATGRLG
ncbi:hypothetical protein BRC71_11830 [Halobacteriales archaeon QH_7_65_31]|nr:MAG: hypothetical protein BRC71_11830 [Halobacteriales archaeon QH_7_65_31]